MAFCEPAEVISVARITPAMMRIRLRALGDWRWHVTGFGDERIDLAFPREHERVAEVAYFNNEHLAEEAGDGEPPWRHYTVRSVHAQGAELEIDFAIHEVGVASNWVQRAEPGHVLGVFCGSAAPRAYYAPPEDTDWQLLVADSTGLPGLGRIVEELEPGQRAIAVIEVPSEADRQEIETDAQVQWVWLVGPGGEQSVLPEAVNSLVLPGGSGYVWGALEASAARAVRKELKQVHGVPRDRQRIVGYWNAGLAGHVD